MRGKRSGDTAAAKLLRQERVYKFLLFGLGPREISAQMGVTVRTIQTDYRQIKARLLQTVQAAELRSLKLGMAELDIMWHEGWSLYFRASRDMATKDDRMVKLAILNGLLRISTEKNRLAFLGPQIRTVATQGTMQLGEFDEETRATILAEITNQMPAGLRNGIIAWVRKEAGLQSGTIQP
jgi:hypothetical protein